MNFSNPAAPGTALYSAASNILKFISANMGLIKTKLGNAMQERHSTGFNIEQYRCIS